MTRRMTVQRLAFGLGLLVLVSVLLVGCGTQGPSKAAEEVIRGSEFGFANASLAYDGDVSAEEEISEDGNSAQVTLLAEDGSRKWVIDLEKQDGEWIVVDGSLELLKDITITIP
ncbi:MAG: hypothetical protein U1F44_00395 [Coriobacteriia bacterium]|nr:hypothetical protein [Coriobacteriia bacterium]